MGSSKLPFRKVFIHGGFNALTEDELLQVDISKMQCPICYDDFANADQGSEIPVKLTVCGHIFGKECLNAYLNSKSATGIYQDRCPQCRIVMYRRGFPHNIWAWVNRNQYMLGKYYCVVLTTSHGTLMMHGIYRFIRYEPVETYDFWQLWLLFMAIFETYFVVFMTPNFWRQNFPDYRNWTFTP